MEPGLGDRHVGLCMELGLGSVPCRPWQGEGLGTGWRLPGWPLAVSLAQGRRTDRMDSGCGCGSWELALSSHVAQDQRAPVWPLTVASRLASDRACGSVAETSMLKEPQPLFFFGFEVPQTVKIKLEEPKELSLITVEEDQVFKGMPLWEGMAQCNILYFVRSTEKHDCRVTITGRLLL